MSCGYMHEFPGAEVDWESNPTYNQYKEWTWQLSRHHEWRCLGRCYRETNDERYAETFVKFLLSWCKQATCPENVSGGATNCWRTIEAGIRMTKNWHYALHAFYKSPAMTDHAICTYYKSIWEHGYRLRNFCTGANWLIMEMTGLLHIGVLYPCFNEAEAWKEYAFKRLVDEIDLQIYPDSFQYELSTGYHGVSLQNYIWSMNICKAMEVDSPKEYIDGLSRLYEMYLKLMQPDGKLPDLNDGGRTSSVAQLKNALAYFPDREDYKYIVSGGKEGTEPSFKSIALPYSGMSVMRTGWGKDDIWFFFESAPFGKGHQHEDKLNVLMFAYGKDVLPDTGNYAYDSSEMRKFVLDTRSHNCAMVDEKSQNRRAKYNWVPEAITKLSDLKWSYSDDVDVSEGVYNEGYGKEFIDVTHKRKVIFFKKGVNSSLPFALICDRLTANDNAPHKYAVSYQMTTHPYEVDKNTVTFDFGDNVTLSLIGSTQPEIISAQKEPLYMGWRKAPKTDNAEPEHYPAPCVRYVAEGVKEQRFISILYPSNNKKTAIKEIKASEDVSDTKITLIFDNGTSVTLDENDFHCDN